MSPEPKTAAVSPKDRRIPLASLEFNKPVALEGFIALFRRLFKGEAIDLDVPAKKCPKMFFDPDLQAVQVGDEYFPIHLVSKFTRAKAA